MELSKRLFHVASMVSPDAKVADIGCDHGYVSIYLVEQKIAAGVIAMDVNEGPLKRAREHIKEAGLDTYIQTRLSDGAGALEPGEADTAVIAGMGGKLMVRILEEAKKKAVSFRELVLQPQSEIFKVREYLWEQNYQIVSEDMVFEEGKYYQIIKAVENVDCKDACIKEQTTDAMLCGRVPEQYENKALLKEAIAMYGPYLLTRSNPVCKMYLEYENNQYKRIREHIMEQGAVSKRERIEEIDHKLLILKTAKELGAFYGNSTD